MKSEIEQCNELLYKSLQEILEFSILTCLPAEALLRTIATILTWIRVQEGWRRLVNEEVLANNRATHFSTLFMSKPIHLPDAVPALTAPALLVVCGSHQCRMINAGGRTLVEREVVSSPEHVHTDRESEMRGPSGVTSGTGDRNQEEENRLKQFANLVTKQIVAGLEQGAEELYLAAPSKVLSILKDHLPKAHASTLKVVLDGTFLKESSIDILFRFRPDLADGVSDFRDREGFSSKKHLPK